MNEEITYKLFTLIDHRPSLSQRGLAMEMRISLGKTNRCIKDLIEKGWLEVRVFKNSKNKTAYTYMLTPAGLSEKAEVTARYLKRKVREYKKLGIEIEKLRQEISGISEEPLNIFPEVDKMCNPTR